VRAVGVAELPADVVDPGERVLHGPIDGGHSGLVHVDLLVMVIWRFRGKQMTTSTQRVDPVCGLEVDAETPYRVLHGGRELWFCSSSCLAEFQRHPERYAVAPRESRADRR
jgi:YHS domain-containing protein